MGGAQGLALSPPQFYFKFASKGIDQRMIDEWVGYTTESMRRRYRHLFPSSQKTAMKELFA